MSQSGDYRFFAGEKFQAVSLPYGTGRVSMYVFLPDPDSSLADFYTVLNAANWEKWMKQFSETKGNIILPRFKLEYEQKLNDALKALGMEVAFDRDRAEFRELIDLGQRRAFISEVKHKTFVEVNEEGTEAAAATSVEFGVTCVREEFSMVVDRPFFFAIRDNQTGALLFAGSVVDPRV
jgi:serpin B